MFGGIKIGKNNKCRRNAMKMRKEIKSRANAQTYKAGDQKEDEENFFKNYTTIARNVCKHLTME